MSRLSSSMVRVIPTWGTTSSTRVSVPHGSVVRGWHAAGRNSPLWLLIGFICRWLPLVFIDGLSLPLVDSLSILFLMVHWSVLSARYSYLASVFLFFFIDFLYPRVHYALSASFYHCVYPSIESLRILLFLTPKLLHVIFQPLLPASRVICNKLLAKCSSDLSFKRFSLWLTSCFLRCISSRKLSLSSSLDLLRACSSSSSILFKILVRASYIDIPFH